MKKEYVPAWVGVALIVMIAITAGVLGDAVGQNRKRIEMLERRTAHIVAENPVNREYGGDHVMATILKHSPTCPCLKP